MNWRVDGQVRIWKEPKCERLESTDEWTSQNGLEVEQQHMTGHMSCLTLQLSYNVVIVPPSHLSGSTSKLQGFPSQDQKVYLVSLPPY